jgi:uncharacterized small protein (DUF1192 family)
MNAIKIDSAVLADLDAMSSTASIKDRIAELAAERNASVDAIDCEDLLAACLAAASETSDIESRIAALTSALARSEAEDAAEHAAFVQAHRCHKCGGKGNLDAYAHIANGVCFDCGGKGYIA